MTAEVCKFISLLFALGGAGLEVSLKFAADPCDPNFKFIVDVWLIICMVDASIRDVVSTVSYFFSFTYRDTKIIRGNNFMFKSDIQYRITTLAVQV